MRRLGLQLGWKMTMYVEICRETLKKLAKMKRKGVLGSFFVYACRDLHLVLKKKVY